MASVGDWQGLARLGMHGVAARLMGQASGGHGGVPGAVGVPWIWQGEGASGVPIQRNLLDVYPALEI